ncbi:MAG: 1-acyl-sn-glycerol-3-phosphate acyltransferase [Candidatus Omnitrophota bacterium]|jgi:1-acyl-sn-glycerol-3-phosphate acyltransferase
MITHSRNPLITHWFSAYAKGKLKKNFSNISLTKTSSIPKFEDNIPVIVISNHSSWWDAMLAMYLGWYVFKREYYGVFAAEQLKRYGIFRKVGCFGIDRDSSQDTREFLRYTQKLLNEQSRLLWIYPQGDLISAEALPLVFKKGYVNILSRLKRVHLLKTTVSYDFWLESKPEIVMDIMPLEYMEPKPGASFTNEINERIQCELSERLAVLRDIVRTRDKSQLNSILTAQHGTNIVYDGYRYMKSKLAGEEFQLSHEAKL